jgi:hypothetical protein
MRSTAWIVFAAGALSLGACASLKPAPIPHIAPPPQPAQAAAAVAPRAPAVIRTPAPVKEACVPKGLARAPKYPDTDAALREAGGAADRYQLMAAGRLLRQQRLTELEKVVDACR